MANSYESLYQGESCIRSYYAIAAQTAGNIVQLKDGKAGQITSDLAAGDLGSVRVRGILRNVAKTTSMAFVDGQPVYWDHSANKAHYKKVNDKDFYLGTAHGDWLTEAATTMSVDLNNVGHYTIDLFRDPAKSALAGTAAAGAFGYPKALGGGCVLDLTATNEAQKVDLMSVDGVAVASNFIVEGSFRILSDGSNATQDFTIGIASGTHATDFQSVAEFVAISTVGGSTNINVQSDDGTTDVAPTDSTLDYTEGTTWAERVHFVIDARDHTDVQVYINGTLVLGATTFTLSAASGPLFLIAHLEKTSGTDTYSVGVDSLKLRMAEQNYDRT